MTYDFHDKLKEGQKQEKELDKYFKQWYNIREATTEEQRAGIDRVFTRPDGSKVNVEYKSDFMASKTGNSFIETDSVIEKDKLGWAVTSASDIIVYYLPNDKRAYILETDEVKRSVLLWQGKYQTKTVQSTFGDTTYSTAGLLVPLQVLHTECKAVRSIV